MCLFDPAISLPRNFAPRYPSHELAFPAVPAVVLAGPIAVFRWLSLNCRPTWLRIRSPLPMRSTVSISRPCPIPQRLAQLSPRRRLADRPTLGSIPPLLISASPIVTKNGIGMALSNLATRAEANKTTALNPWIERILPCHALVAPGKGRRMLVDHEAKHRRG